VDDFHFPSHGVQKTCLANQSMWLGLPSLSLEKWV